MRFDRRTPVAIVGGGFSGTMVAAHLARRGVRALLIDGSGRAGLGTAYSTDEPAHLLNVRAEAMSAWPDEPGDFAEVSGDPRGFAERRQFGRYLRAILAEATASGCVRLVESNAVAASRNASSWLLSLENGERIEAGALVLANGNQPPEPLGVAAAAGERFVGNPWGAEAKAAIAAAARSGGGVLLIGTGLTMIDAALSLDAAGHDGRIVALSRRGLVPRSHADFAPAAVEAGVVPSGNLLALWRWVRRRSGEVGWRAAVDSLRPFSHELWQAFDHADQQRFLRHARPWWDVHRHRIAPQVARRIAELIAAGRMEIVAGKIGPLQQDAGSLNVPIRRRGRPEPEQRRFDYVINCTGPLGAIARTSDPLLAQMLADGLLRPDQLGMGVEVDRRSRAAGGKRLWAVGPLTKARYWEIVAVPDIRGQAAAVAEDIAKEVTR